MRLLKSTVTVGGATFLSRILGFIRDVVLARVFGASGATDAFFLAFRIPNLLRRMFAEGSFSLAFVPVLSEYRENGDREATRDLVDHVTGTLLAVLLVITAIGVLAAPYIMMLFAPGWYAEGRPEFALSSDLLRITFPYILFISMTALAGGILNTWDRFLVPALTPILLNLSLIAAALLLADRMAVPVAALAWGVLVAGVVQMLVQIPALARLGLVPRPKWGAAHAGVRRVMKLMLPTLLGSSVAQINILIDSIIATFLVAGSVSWLYYSDRLLEFPVGVFGVALATVVLPNLSRKHAADNPQAFSATLDWALRLSAIITLPAATGLAVLAGPILVTLFQYGAFTATDRDMATLSLVAYATGLPAFIAVKALAPGYFARQDASTPVKIGLLAMGANVILNLAFVGSLVEMGFRGPHTGLALASSVSAWLNAGLLYRGLRRRQVYHPGTDWGRTLLASLAGCVVMAAVLYFLAGSPLEWAEETALYRGLRLLWMIALGVVVYAAIAAALGLRPRHLLAGAR